MAEHEIFNPSDAVKALWPMDGNRPISGNDVNGLGAKGWHSPRPVFWRLDGFPLHEPV